MGFFSRFAKKIEQVNKGEAPLEELGQEFYIEDQEQLKDLAVNNWKEMAQNILINAVKGANQSVERAFVFIDFQPSNPSFDIFYQENGKIVHWFELEDQESVETIKQRLLPQAKEVVPYLHQLFDNAKLERIAYAELQFEAATMAWFSHIICQNDKGAELPVEEIKNEWFRIITEVASKHPLDSDRPLPWYP